VEAGRSAENQAGSEAAVRPGACVFEIFSIIRSQPRADSGNYGIATLLALACRILDGGRRSSLCVKQAISGRERKR